MKVCNCGRPGRRALSHPDLARAEMEKLCSLCHQDQKSSSASAMVSSIGPSCHLPNFPDESGFWIDSTNGSCADVGQVCVDSIRGNELSSFCFFDNEYQLVVLEIYFCVIFFFWEKSLS